MITHLLEALTDQALVQAAEVEDPGRVHRLLQELVPSYRPQGNGYAERIPLAVPSDVDDGA